MTGINDTNDDKKNLTVEEIDEKLRSAEGDPYGHPPDVASYLKYVLKGVPLNVCFKESSAEELQDVHILITAKVMDHGLNLKDNPEGAFIVAAFARLVADRLCAMGYECRPLEIPKNGWMSKDARAEEKRRVKLAFIKSLSGTNITEDDVTATFLRTEENKRVYIVSHGVDVLEGDEASSEVYLHDEKSVSVCLIQTWTKEDGYTYRYKWNHYNDNARAEAEKEIKKEDMGMKQYLVTANCPYCAFIYYSQGRYFAVEGDDARPISQAQIDEAADDAFDDLQKKHNGRSDCKERIRAW